VKVERVLSNENQELIIKINGRFDLSVLQEFRAAYTDNACQNIILDMRDTEHMDSSALSMLLHMRRNLEKSVKISLLNCSPRIMKILTLSRFDQQFHIE